MTAVTLIFFSESFSQSVVAQQFHHNIQLHYNWQGISLVACPKEIYDFLWNLLFFSWGVQHHSSRYKLFPFTTVRKWMLRSFTVCAFYSPCPIISDMILFLLFAFHCKTQHKPQQRALTILHISFSTEVTFDHAIISEIVCLWNHHWDLLANTHPNPELSPQVAQAFKPNVALHFSSNINLLGRASLSSRAGSSFLDSINTVMQKLLL